MAGNLVASAFFGLSDAHARRHRKTCPGHFHESAGSVDQPAGTTDGDAGNSPGIAWTDLLSSGARHPEWPRVLVVQAAHDASRRRNRRTEVGRRGGSTDYQGWRIVA